MIINKLDSIEFRLKELHDFTWLKKYGTAFWVVDETGSGCICIGMEDAERKYFCKIAGVNTVEAEVSPEESVKILKEAVRIGHEKNSSCDCLCPAWRNSSETGRRRLGSVPIQHLERSRKSGICIPSTVDRRYLGRAPDL